MDNRIFEDALRNAWRETLAIADIQGVDDVFEFGATSIQLVSVMRRFVSSADLPAAVRISYRAKSLDEMAVNLAELIATPRLSIPAQIAPKRGKGSQPLSPNELHFYRQMQANPAAPFLYSVQGFVVGGPLSVAKFSQALARLAAKHDALRSSFHTSGGKVWRQVSLSIMNGLEERRLPDAFSPSDVASLVEHFRASIDQAQTAPLWRIYYFSVSPIHHILVFVIHSLIADGYAVRTLMKELSAIYGETDFEQRDPAQDISVSQPEDYVTWLHANYPEDLVSKHRVAFRRMLHGARFVTPLAPVSSATQDNGGPLKPPTLSISAENMTRLIELAILQRTTIYSILLAAYVGVLHKHTGLTDILVRTAGSARDDLRLKDIVGLLWSPLFVRCKFSHSSTFAQLISIVSEAAFAAREFMQLPFDEAVAALQSEGDLTTVNLHFSMHDGELGELLAFEDCKVSRIQTPTITRGPELKVHVRLGNHGISGYAHFDEKQISHSYVVNLIADLRSAIVKMVEDPERTITS